MFGGNFPSSRGSVCCLLTCPLPSQMSKPSVTIQLGGCAGLNHYMFGVGAYIQEHYILGEEVQIQTISGSNYVGMCLLSGFSVESIWRLWSHRLDALFRSRPWTGLWEMCSMMEDHSRECVQKDFAQYSSLERYGQHSIRIALLNRMVTRWFRAPDSLEDYLSAIFAGAFIPGICGRWWRLHRGHRCVDGGLRLPWTPRSTRPATPCPRTVSVSVWDCRTLSRARLAFLAVYGLWCGADQHRIQFAHGYIHAQTVLGPRLEELLPRRTLPLPEMTGPLQWDPKQHIFRE